jgi:hypothetical protein
MRFSVKQINMFGALVRKPGALGGCPRSWGARYLDSIKPDYLDENLVFGIKFHNACASLVSTGRMPTPATLQPGVIMTEYDCAPDGQLGKMARSAIIHLPRSSVPETGMEFKKWIVEAQWLFPWTTTQGITVEIDLRPDVCADSMLVDLLDWKSTSDKRWALKSIVDDVQANVYAVGLMHHFQRQTVIGRWVYVEKKAPFRSWPVDGMFHHEKTTRWMHENVDATLELMHTYKEMGLSAFDLPGDIGACEGVGKRCDFEGPCLGPVGPKSSKLITIDEVLRYKGSV